MSVHHQNPPVLHLKNFLRTDDRSYSGGGRTSYHLEIHLITLIVGGVEYVRPSFLYGLYYVLRAVTNMEYVYAALLLHKRQKEVNEDNLKAVVSASGADVNEAQVKSLVAALADVDINEAIKAAPVAVAAAPAPVAEAEPEKEAEAKEEKKEEKNEEAAMEGLSSLFG